MKNYNLVNLANDRAVTTTITHELKTPLNAIMGFTDLILEEDCISKIRDYADIIKSNSEVLLEKIYKVIDYNTLELDSSVLLERISLSEMFERASKILKLELRKNNREIHVVNKPHKQMSDIVFYSDRGKLEKLFTLLLSSASYLNKSGQLFLDYSINNEMISLNISIDQETIKGPEEQFVPMLEDGIGINIAICEKLSKLVGGKMALKFDSYCKNIEFKFPFKNRYKDTNRLSDKDTVLVVDDDFENFSQIKRHIPGSEFMILRTSEAYFNEGVSDSIAAPKILIINSGSSGVELKESVRKIREKSPVTFFLINLYNHVCLDAFSHNYNNVRWYKPATFKAQFERILSMNNKMFCNEKD